MTPDTEIIRKALEYYAKQEAEGRLERVPAAWEGTTVMRHTHSQTVWL